MDKPTHYECVIAVIPDASGTQRVVFASRSGHESLPIVLRQETYSRDVGWFAQSQIELTREQMVLLRSGMGGALSSPCQQTMLSAAQETPATIPFQTATRLRQARA
ncbi:hypothetical protein SH139x_005821 [Planctomycetaceae bacterium SH139]